MRVPVCAGSIYLTCDQTHTLIVCRPSFRDVVLLGAVRKSVLESNSHRHLQNANIDKVCGALCEGQPWVLKKKKKDDVLEGRRDLLSVSQK